MPKTYTNSLFCRHHRFWKFQSIAENSFSNQLQFCEQGSIQVIIHQGRTRNIFSRTEETSDHDCVSQQAEKYQMKVAKSNFSGESFDHLRYIICTHRKTKLVDLHLKSAAIEGHLLQVYYFTNIFLKFPELPNQRCSFLNFISMKCLRNL